jgi:hypothetical protein
MRSRPYRNDRIITVIRDMFFVGGAASFAHNFQYLFLTYEIADGEIVLEVPIPMVALVTTAVSPFFGLCIVLTLCVSCTPCSTSGALEIINLQSSRPMHIWTCIKAMSIL